MRLAPVEGVVKLNGQPLSGAGVMFVPLSSTQGPPATGSTDKQGHFVLMTNNRKGAPLGDHRVSISKADPFGETIPPEQLEMSDVVRRRGLTVFKTKYLIPAKYSDPATSTMTATVEDKKNSFEFALTSP